MKTEKEIMARIKELKNDYRLKQKTAFVEVNAPLALMQCELEGEIEALKWCIEK